MNKSIFLCILFITLFSCSTQKTRWAEPTQTSKPWTRWWWMNNAVDKENLTREMQEFAKMGIGGMEITPIYGVRGEESRTIEFLSPEFSEILKFTIEQANESGLGVDLPPGSGWRCGGPFVPEEKGLWNLRIQTLEIKQGDVVDLAKQFDNGTCANFVSNRGKSEIIDLKEPFEAHSNGIIHVALRVKSNNDVKRPAVGGEGWAIDTFNEEITNWYLNEFWKRLGIDEGLLRCFFHDSFEYTGDFTTHFLDEFYTRRGYHLAKYLHALSPDCENKELAARVKSDYRETLADLVLDSFIQPMTDWANSHKSLNRNQAHGSPGNILDLYAACDIPETEIFQRLNQGSPDIFVNKFASSAAHVTGKKLVSSESYTWLDEHWTVTPTELVRATNRFFLAGVNHMFFHGTCYSPADATWPGWLFYASTQMNNRNPIWREMPILFKYIERTQNIMQQTTSESDVLIYWPYYDVAAGEGRIFNHIGVNKDAGWFHGHPIALLSENLTKKGYVFDYISDKQLLNCKVQNGKIISAGNAMYKAVVIPETGYMPVETLQKLENFIASGGKVVFDKKLPESVPGMYKLEERLNAMQIIKKNIQPENIGQASELLDGFGIVGEKDLSDNGFHFLKMNATDGTYYLVFNLSTETIDKWVTLQTNARSFTFMNPMNGTISSPGYKSNKIRIQLKPEEIMFVKCSQKSSSEKPHVYFDEKLQKKNINGKWNIEFVEGGPDFPQNAGITELVSWTRFDDAATKYFAGTARYSLNFDWEGSNSGFLDLGEVRDCARVFVNDKDYGALLGPGFSVFVDNLKNGSNKIVVEVTNIAANRIRDLDQRGEVWRNFYDINLVNIDYKPFDASAWEIREAGLLGPVIIYSE